MTIVADVPDSYHVVLIAGMVFYVDASTRKEIESFLRTAGALDSLTVDSLVGEEITVVAGSVQAFYSTTPETRRRDREIRKSINAENPEDL